MRKNSSTYTSTRILNCKDFLCKWKNQSLRKVLRVWSLKYDIPVKPKIDLKWSFVQALFFPYMSRTFYFRRNVLRQSLHWQGPSGHFRNLAKNDSKIYRTWYLLHCVQYLTIDYCNGPERSYLSCLSSHSAKEEVTWEEINSHNALTSPSLVILSSTYNKSSLLSWRRWIRRWASIWTSRTRRW